MLLLAEDDRTYADGTARDEARVLKLPRKFSISIQHNMPTLHA